MNVIPLLGVAFVVLKLCHVIAWSWLWVLAPFWLGAAIVIAVWAFALAMVVLVGAHR
jgi:hypothetical protein